LICITVHNDAQLIHANFSHGIEIAVARHVAPGCLDWIEERYFHTIT